MKYFLLTLFLFLQFGCATKFILPGNRFMTPESQGGIFKTQTDFQQTQGNQFLVKRTDSVNEDNGVYNAQISRSAFYLGTSFFESMDIYWSHTGTANSLIGFKWQFLGASRETKEIGHKLAISFAFGGNQYQEDTNPGVEFDLSGKEMMLLYGYRLNEWFLPYFNLMYSTYNFDGTINSSNPTLDNRKLDYQSKMMATYLGGEFLVSNFVFKLEYGYQQISVTKSEDFTGSVFGYSLGYIW